MRLDGVDMGMHLISDIKKTFVLLQSWEVERVKREANSEANASAKNALSNSDDEMQIEEIPSCICPIAINGYDEKLSIKKIKLKILLTNTIYNIPIICPTINTYVVIDVRTNIRHIVKASIHVYTIRNNTFTI